MNGKRLSEHRYLMEKEIGRKLFTDETVHHRNGNRSDNRISNLEICDTAQPKGQRIEDKIEYATMILNRYAQWLLVQDSL